MIGASVNFRRLQAVVILQDAQGWKSISDTQNIRAQVDYTEIKALNVYTLIVDKIDLTDEIIAADSVIFNVGKALSDDVPVIESIAFDVSKPFNDDIAAGESIAFLMNKPFSDDVGNSDSTVYSMDKGLSDDVPATDDAIFNLISVGSGALNGVLLDGAAIARESKTVKVF